MSAAWLGSANRQDDFRTDTDLPSGWYQVKPATTPATALTAGNLPLADRTGSVADNAATFLMSNMMPQAPNNNQQTWVRLVRTSAASVGSAGKGC